MTRRELIRLLNLAIEQGGHVPRDCRASWILGFVTADLDPDEQDRLVEYLTGAPVQ